MIKVTIKGDVYSFDNESYALTEAIELEEGLGMAYGEYQRGLVRGSAKALAGFVWLVLKRNDGEVPLADILSGKYALNESDVLVVEEEADPTDPPSGAPDGSTSEPSPKSSGSGRGKPGSSPSKNSTP